ncbi:MAG TPA: hypothetical protein VN541_19790 [Tepidisphaeraceae bacterium]|nr:hypothetical protein [Tepidisphaeraceae bacterium]
MTESNSPETIPYATPAPRRWTRTVGRWFSRRAATAGPRMIALAILAFVGVTCAAPNQMNVVIYNLGDLIFRVSLILFALEYAMSLFH